MKMSNKKNKQVMMKPKKGQKNLSKKSIKPVNKKLKPTKEKKVQSLDDFLEDFQKDDSDGGEEVMESDEEQEVMSDEEEELDNQKDFITKLSEKDPEFHKFLLENDKALLEVSDTDESDENNDDEDGEKVHKIPEQLEVASDESDYENEEAGEQENNKKRKKLNQKDLDKLEVQLMSNNPSIKSVEDVAQALKSAIFSLNDGKNEDLDKGKWKVEGGTMFNSIIRLCLTRMEGAFQKVLKIEGEVKPKKLPKSKKWKPLNRTLKSYTLDLTRLISVISEETALCAVLKHVHAMLAYFACLPKSAKVLLQKLVLNWSTGSEAARMSAFLCIIRLTRIMGNDASHENLIKQMYMAYVKNCRFTSPNTWPVINFMRRSLSEMFCLNSKLAYNHVFVYIRQLGISLRNAITLHKKESVQSVYNWQFVHSIHLWVQVLCTSHPNEALAPLIYPLVQVIDGAIRLVYTSKYYPLRFHLCQMLVRLSSETGQFVPILPYYLDILNNYNFNKKNAKISMKPVDFESILRVSKSQIAENGTKDATMDKVYLGILEYLSSRAHKISFPELVIPCVMQLKVFLKKCKVPNYCKKIRQLVDKIEENRTFIIRERKTATFSLSDTQKISQWEETLKTKGCAMTKFCASMKQIKVDEKKRVNIENISDDYDFIPKLKNKNKMKKSGEKIESEFKGLLEGDDDESDIDDETRFASKEAKNAKKRKAESNKKNNPKKLKQEEDSSDDDYDELDSDELDQLDSDESLEEEFDVEVKKKKSSEKKNKKSSQKAPKQTEPEEDNESGDDEEDELKTMTLDDLDSEEEENDSDLPDDEVSEMSGAESSD